MTHILIVDDDDKLRELLQNFLIKNGFYISQASSPLQARIQLANNKFDLMIVDVMMPGEDGIHFVKSLRPYQALPILFLSACDQVDDRIAGLDCGGDDYLIKPFEPRELLSRIQALLRRSQKQEKATTLRLGDYVYDCEAGSLFKDDERIFLSSTELILLKTLAQQPGQAFSRDELAQRLGHRVSERTVDVQITRLRRKLQDDPRQPLYIQTVRHRGYALCPNQD